MKIWEHEELDWDTFAAFVANPESVYKFECEARYIMIPKGDYVQGQMSHAVLKGPMCAAVLFERQFKHTENLESLTPKELMDHSFVNIGSILVIDPFFSDTAKYMYEVVGKSDTTINISIRNVRDDTKSVRTYSLEEMKQGCARAFPSLKSNC